MIKNMPVIYFVNQKHTGMTKPGTYIENKITCVLAKDKLTLRIKYAETKIKTLAKHE